MKNISIGIENYLQVSRTYYVDKSLFIKTIIDFFIEKSILITRPRRFGKSLMLSMIDYFFTNKGDYLEYFRNKNIFSCGEDYISHMNKYPVIHINMKNVSRISKEELFKDVIDLISDVYAGFSELKTSDKLLDVEKKDYIYILNKKSNSIYDYTTSILNLSKYLYKHYNEKIIILLDEYDTPIEYAYQNGYYDDVVPFFRQFYSSFLKANNYLFFSILTGVLEIAKESLFSDLNNLNVYSTIDKDLIEYFGFTKSEVLELLSFFNVKTNIDDIEKWYGGYETSEIEIYNPWSVLNYVNKERFETFWANTGSNETIARLVNNIDESKYVLNEFINNKNKLFTFSNSISYKDIRNNNATLFSYLVQAGYLVAKYSGIDNLFLLSIPNKEIDETLKKEVIARNLDEDYLNLGVNLKNAIMLGNVEYITNSLNSYVLKSFSYFDLNREKEYQVMMVGILAVLFNDYIVKSEVINKNGRCDIMLVPKSTKNIGIIIEIKKNKGVLSSSNLLASSKTAINQIKKQEYYNELSLLNIDKILLYGIAFDDKKSNLSLEIISSKSK